LPPSRKIVPSAPPRDFDRGTPVGLAQTPDARRASQLRVEGNHEHPGPPKAPV
jgi:hypothetical protein